MKQPEKITVELPTLEFDYWTEAKEMKVSELIKELQKCIERFGDLEITMRVCDNSIASQDFDALSVYGDIDAEKIIISDYDC